MKHASLGAPLAFLAVAAIAALAPFASKAFHMDDTLFLWTSAQVLDRPWDFYGFTGNWAGTEAAATAIIKNPPLAAYYMAAASLLFGAGERALHLAFILPSVLGLWGTYLLASRLTRAPLLAASATLAAPAYLVSSTTLMCDVLMLAFWVWAAFFWVKGVDEGSAGHLATAAALAGLGALTKYFGVSLIPLLAAYSLLRGSKGLSSLPFLLIPAALLAGYNWYTYLLYGKGLLMDASSYATRIQAEGGPGEAERLMVGLAFTGGCVATAFFVLPVLWGLRAAAAGAALALGSLAWVLNSGSVGGVDLAAEGFGLLYASQLALYAATGAGIAALVFRDLISRRDAGSALLALWVAGTFAFTLYFNWTINARSILPMAPAAGILIARAADDAGASWRRAWLPLAPALALSLLVAWADYALAGSARQAAAEISARHAGQGRALWFQGHWGFQYYMEAAGALPIDWKRGGVRKGDAVAFPFNNTGLRPMRQESMTLAEDLSYAGSGPFATMTLGPGAGFYASEWGPLPFMLLPPNEERYWVVYMK